MSFSRPTGWCLTALFVNVSLCPRTSAAQVVEGAGEATATERAETLFRRGRVLLEERRYDEACPLLDESFRVEPETGTLLALAVCLEGQERLAGALTAYDLVAERAARSDRSDREKVARERAALLRAKVSTLKVIPPAEHADIPGFRVLRDGVEITRQDWGIAVPVDGGEHLLDVSAPGKVAWSYRLVFAKGGDHQTVILPRLEDSPAPSSPAPPFKTLPVAATNPQFRAANATASPAVPTAPTGLSTTQVAGVAMTAAGIVGLGIGSYFGLRAINRQSDFEDGCRPEVCSAAARYALEDARFAGNASTISFVAGGVMSAVGLTFVILGADLGPGRQPGIRAGMAFAREATELRVRGAF